ncbi:MAG: alpha-N-acetylglucosaminidase [Bacteroides pyogenes]|uniref:alpha-N-acetylglucosaminidase n=1 Tax=Bacteroides pyogenes TaxID=310300 RepID=UPI002A90922B|nr:alpha-N-acetylglucosaminidase [Bacteroides pyogenes]MDY5354572.1 alpha-N-acetylglucosaminidase [Bacteroides pyogenes]
MTRIYCFLLISLTCLPLSALSDEAVVVTNLAKRLIPEYTAYFCFSQEKKEDGKDSFTLESKDGKILIRGNSANSMAVALNYYLKYYCKTTVSWYADIPVEMPEVLPIIPYPIRKEAKVERRFFLNYCTYGYTMPFWKWSDWERLIDWMALNGVNMPLAITGQEAVWYKVWSKLGLTDEEIRSYFTGPTYLPWHRMANIDGWNGPLPKHWLDTQVELQKKILARERELKMRPVLPAFAGHVPGALKRLYPHINIKYLSKWAGFSDANRCHFLNPEEPLFAEIQQLFLHEQNMLFGTDHIYGVDPFNEVDPPSWEPDYLKQVSSDMYKTLTQADPKAEWMQMTWMFYFDRKKWTPSRVEALLTGVPQNKMVLLDYHCENVELWKTTKSFHGQPYIWCYLGNFGGNTTLTGNVKESGERLNNALLNGGSNLCGIGSTLEGLDVVQFPYEYIFEKAWTDCLTDEQWVNALADRHVGGISKKAREAWQILFNDIYVQVPKTLGVLPNLRPVMDKKNKRTVIEYDNDRLFEVWKLLVSANISQRDALQLDIITVGRQWMGNYFLELKNKFDKAYHAKNKADLQKYILKMQDLLTDIDKLTSFHPFTSIHHWLNKAREYSENVVLADYYELNARNLITTWGGSLNDYASRTWSGLVSNYYTYRWNLYFDAVIDAIEHNKSFDQGQLDRQIKTFEDSWVKSTAYIKTNQKGDLQEFVSLLIKKYEK